MKRRERPCGIYAIVNTVNGKLYVGQSTDITKRWMQHRCDLNSDRTKPNPKLRNAWRKYGEHAFAFIILRDGLQPHELTAHERFWIELLHPFYNVMPAADSPLGLKASAETRAKQSAAQRGKPKSPEHVAKVAEALRGRKRPELAEKMRGRVLSEETRAKISAARRKAA